MEFTNSKTKADYALKVDTDRKVIVPGVPGKRAEYAGMLSNITPEVAEAMVQQGCYHLLERKTTTAPSKSGSEK